MDMLLARTRCRVRACTPRAIRAGRGKSGLRTLRHTHHLQRRLRRLPDNERCFYEMVREGREANLYLDVEYRGAPGYDHATMRQLLPVLEQRLRAMPYTAEIEDLGTAWDEDPDTPCRAGRAPPRALAALLGHHRTPSAQQIRARPGSSSHPRHGIRVQGTLLAVRDTRPALRRRVMCSTREARSDMKRILVPRRVPGGGLCVQLRRRHAANGRAALRPSLWYPTRALLEARAGAPVEGRTVHRERTSRRNSAAARRALGRRVPWHRRQAGKLCPDFPAATAWCHARESRRPCRYLGVHQKPRHAHHLFAQAWRRCKFPTRVGALLADIAACRMKPWGRLSRRFRAIALAANRRVLCMSCN